MIGDREVGGALLWSALAPIPVGLLARGVGGPLDLVGARGGRLLPGDIVVSRQGVVFVAPLAASPLVSPLSTLLVGTISARRR